MANAKWHGDLFKKQANINVEKSLEKAAFFVEGEAKKNLTISGAVDTGTLRASIHSVFVNKGTIHEAYVGTDMEAMKKIASGKLSKYKSTRMTERRAKLTGIATGTITFYAPFIEFGTYKMRARPYLRPALGTLRAHGWGRR